MKLPDFTQDAKLNSLREKIWAEINFLYRPKNKPIWDLKVENLVKNRELFNLDLSEVKVSSNELLEYKWVKVLLYKQTQVERITEWAQQFHFYNCATVKKFREEKKYTWKYVITRKDIFKVDIESFWKQLQKNVLLPLNVCKNCLKESNYYNYENADYNMKNNIYRTFSIKEYLEAVD